MAGKVDNHNLEAKLALRRHFLRKYHADQPIHVLDCCQGGGLLWRELRKEFETASYWGLDLKPKKGRLKLDSVRVLQQPGWPQNVIDIDTYGSPWKHWQAMLPNIQQPVTAFLTRGSHTTEPLDEFERRAIGLVFSRPIARAFYPKIQMADFAIRACITRLIGGIMLVEAAEAVSGGNARYIGVRLEPEKAAVTGAVTPATPEHSRSDKETERV
jgi:hypothetical protein